MTRNCRAWNGGICIRKHAFSFRNCPRKQWPRWSEQLPINIRLVVWMWFGRAGQPCGRTNIRPPFPVNNQAWSVGIEEEEIILSVRLGGSRVSLRLKSGPQFRRQRQAVEQMVAGTAVRGECAIYKKGTAIMAKLVGWLPRQADHGSPRKGTLVVRTQADSLLMALNHLSGQRRDSSRCRPAVCFGFRLRVWWRVLFRGRTRLLGSIGGELAHGVEG
jgi:hypothetical protein